MINGAMSCGSVLFKWFCDFFCKDLVEEKGSVSNAYETMDEMASLSGPGAGGLLLLPYFNGERSPVFDSSARGVFFGMGLGSTRSDFIRAIMESVGYGLRQLLEIEESLLGTRIENILVAGGATKDSLWMQILSDIMERSLVISKVTDTGALGAAILSGISAGIIDRKFCAQHKLEGEKFHPNSKLSGLYTEKYLKYVKLYPAVKDLYG